MLSGTDVLASLPIAVHTTDGAGYLTYYNDAAAELWGHRPTLGSARWCGSWRLYWPDGRPMAHAECPLAETLRRGAPVLAAETVAERPDGTRVSLLSYPSLVRDATGTVVGAVNALVELTERRAAELDRARLAAIVASSDDAIISKTLDGVITSWNAGATRIFGYDPDEVVGKPITTIIPPELHDEEASILERLRRGERIEHFDTERVAKDGRRLSISLTVSPIRSAAGEVVGASKVARDVTQRKKGEELQRLLIGELNHRVKNTLATVEAIARQSLRTEPDPGAFVASLTGRIQALARAHDLLTRSEMQRADLAELVREQVERGVPDARIAAAGPLVRLESRVAVQLALVLNELATNARKHGALSVPGGRLDVGWTLAEGGGRELRLTWREAGVPRMSVPERRGFGILVIERSLTGIGGDTRLSYLADGLVCEIRLPLPAEATGALAGPGEPGGAAALGRAGRREVAGRRILVVEDEPLIAMDVEEKLLGAGCDVVGPAGNVATALRLLSEQAIDAALLDANLNGHSVEELAAELARRGVPFAFATGFGRQSLPARFQNVRLLSKPFGGDELIEVVQDLLDSREATGRVVPLVSGR